MSNFQPLEVVYRGSGTQLQVGEKFNYLIYRFKGKKCNINLFKFDEIHIF